MDYRFMPVLVLCIVAAVVVSPCLAALTQKSTGLTSKFTAAGLKSPSYKPFDTYLKDRSNQTTPKITPTPTQKTTPARSTTIYYRVGPLGTGIAPDPSTDMRIILKMPWSSILVEEAIAILPDGRTVSFPRGSMLDRSGILHYPFSDTTVTISGMPFIFTEGIPAKYQSFPTLSSPTTTISSQQPWTYGSIQGYNASNWLSPLDQLSWTLPMLQPPSGTSTGGLFS